jgi:hypothetical protein
MDANKKRKSMAKVFSIYTGSQSKIFAILKLVTFAIYVDYDGEIELLYSIRVTCINSLAS